jgi:hypothetical protein
MVQASPGIKGDPISKISHTRRTGRVAQVVEGLPSKHKAQSLNPSTINQKKKKRGYYLLHNQHMVLGRSAINLSSLPSIVCLQSFPSSLVSL